MEVVAAALRAEGGEVFDFEAAGLFQVVVVGDDVGALLRPAPEEKTQPEQAARQKQLQESPTRDPPGRIVGAAAADMKTGEDNRVQAEIIPFELFAI